MLYKLNSILHRHDVSCYKLSTIPRSMWCSKRQEAQLPQRNSTSAAHIEGGLGPPAHSPSAPSGYTYAYGRIRKPQRTYVKRAVRKAHFKMNRSLKVIQGHPYWCRQESRMVCCRNVQLIPTLFLKLTKIRQRENGKFVDFNDLTQV